MPPIPHPGHHDLPRMASCVGPLSDARMSELSGAGGTNEGIRVQHASWAQFVDEAYWNVELGEDVG